MYSHKKTAWILGEQGFCQASVLRYIWLWRVYSISYISPIEGNYPALYVAGAICATIFEYMTARLMQKLFGEVWWNYDHLRFNYKGIICLQSTLGWGLLAVLIFSVFNKMVERVVFSMDMRVTTVLSIVLVISYVVDFSYHFTKRIANKKMESVVAQASSAGSLQRFFHR